MSKLEPYRIKTLVEMHKRVIKSRTCYINEMVNDYGNCCIYCDYINICQISEAME